MIKSMQTMQKKSILLTLAVALAMSIAIAGVAYATTIGTDITTGGALSVTGATTLSNTLTLTSTTNPQATIRYDTSNYLTAAVGAAGTTTLSAVGGANASFLFSDPLRIATSSAVALEVRGGTGDGPNIFVVNASSGYVGIGLPTPSYPLHVATTTAIQFVVGYNTSNYLSFSVGSGGTTTINAVGSGVPGPGIVVTNPFRIDTSTTDAFEVRNIGGTGTTTMTVDTTNNRVGVGTSSPSAMFAVGNEDANGNRLGTAFGTSTIDLGRVCFRSIDMAGTTFYWWFDLNKGGALATSTRSCF